MKRTVLIIDDDRQLAEVLTEFLGRFEFRVIAATTPSEGLRTLQRSPVDIILLDVMLPEKSGIEVCRDIRNLGDVPVIMLTAQGSATDRVVGLEMGADDYVPKPFDPRELVARIQAILRRPRFIEKRRTLRFGPLEIDLRARVARLDGNAVELTTMEFDILALLASRPGAVLTRDDLLDELQGSDADSYSRTIDVLMSRLRAKLGDDPKHPRYIKTIRGNGYVFVGQADEAA